MGSRPRVGFIGLGSQGAPMARRIVDEGFALNLWARRSSSAESFADTPATLFSSPYELGSASDVVCLCVTGDADVEEVLLGGKGVLAGMAPGSLIVLHSTIHPRTCQRIAEVGAKGDVAVVDAPVSGGGVAAAERRLTVMVGGRDADVAKCRPILETFADPLLHLGPLGSGLVAKLINNYAFTAQLLLALETFDLADRLGISRPKLARVLATGTGGTRALQILMGTNVDLTGIRSAADLLVKDVAIMADLASAASFELPRNLHALSSQMLALLTEPVPRPL